MGSVTLFDGKTLNGLTDAGNANWRVEDAGVLTKGEIPPADEAKMPDEVRGKLIDWSHITERQSPTLWSIL